MNLSWWLAACGCGGAYGKGLTDASMSVHNGGQVAVMHVIFWMMQSKNKNAIEQRVRASGVLIYGGTNIIVSLIILQTIKLNNNKNNSERQYLCNTKNN